MQEYFSDDSLEVSKTSDRKQYKKYIKKNNRTYSQIYQRRLTDAILKLPRDLLKQHISPSESIVPLQAEESTEKNTEPRKITKTILKLPLWSEFLSSKYKMKHPKLEENEKTELLKKRLEYGKRTSRINKVNQTCLQLKKEKEEITTETTIKNNIILYDNAKKTTSIFSKTPHEFKSVQASSCSLTTLQNKLDELKSRHQKDLKIVDKIRGSLSSLSIDLK